MKTYTNFDFSIRMALVANALLFASFFYDPFKIAFVTVATISLAHGVQALVEKRADGQRDAEGRHRGCRSNSVAGGA